MPDVEVSVDEFLSKRKSFVDARGRLHKGIVATGQKGAAPSSFDADGGTCRFTMSAEIEDRDKDIVRQQGLDLSSFLENPAAPFAHNSADFPIGSWKDVEQVLNGRPKRTEGTLVLTAGDPVSDRLKTHLAAGTIRACSIGFMPKRIIRRDTPQDADSYSWPGYDILEAELYECSPCMIPANPAALAKSAEANGSLPSEVLARVLDEWTLADGILLPRKAFEAELAKHVPGKTFSFGGAAFLVDEHGRALKAPEPQDETKGLLRQILGAITGLGKTAPEPKPVPRTPEEEAAEAFAKDLPALVAKHEMIEADARVAVLDSEMGQHVPA